MKKSKAPQINKKKLNDENVELAKLIAKKRDHYICQHCGKTIKETAIHASHVINEASDHRLASDPENIKALCYNCHINRRHKNPVEAGKRFTKKRPGRYEKLQAKHIEYMGMGSININRIIERNKMLREKCEEMKIDISKFKYGKKISG